MNRIGIIIGFFLCAGAIFATSQDDWKELRNNMVTVLKSDTLEHLLESDLGHVILGIELVADHPNPYRYLVHTGPSGYDYSVTDLEFKITKNEDGSTSVVWVD